MKALRVTLSNSRNGQSTVVLARQPSILGGTWIISERARREAFKRVGADWQDTNAGVVSSATLRAVDRNGWHTFTLYA